MRFLTFALTLVFSISVFAQAQLSVVKPVPVAPLVLDTSGTNVTNGAWVQLATAATMVYGCSFVQMHNTGAQPIKLGQGAAASETEVGVIFPIGVTAFMPVNLKKGVRLAVRSMGSTQSSGLLTMSCFQ